ncbi:alpha/beta fold hydrolase [Bacillus sp. BGMRC 2118]|nr:alpha/beta fold hydrolase [Bacillus sp. BGMRC 2118]
MIPSKIYEPENKNFEHTIIIYHGWGSVVDSQHELASILAREGFRVIVPELMYHDNRDPIPHPFHTPIMQEYFWRTIFYSIEEFNLLLNELNTQEQQLILLGSSMGGFIANGIITENPNIAGLININGSGSYLTSETIFRENSGREPLTITEQENFAQYDPGQKEINYNTRILLLHGELDSIVSIEGQKEYYSYITQQGYENVQLITYPEINHTISPEMISDIVDWLKKYIV